MLRFLPWKYIVRKAARRFGVIDPTTWLARLRRFSQPSEVQEPIELLRAGIVFHARGVVNTKAIQHNLDWIWPYWVERQFDPSDPSFVPRAFSFSHINLTHRNWTAVGLPGVPLYPIVDPRGLVTPLHDGWSLDFWIIETDGDRLLPSRLPEESVQQSVVGGSSLAIETKCEHNGLSVAQTTELIVEDNQPILRISLNAAAPKSARLVAAIRPYNPEGVQFVDSISRTDDHSTWRVNDRTDIKFSREPDAANLSKYDAGDVFHEAPADVAETHVECDTGMATAAIHFGFEDSTGLVVKIPLTGELSELSPTVSPDLHLTWPSARAMTAKLKVPDERIQRLYDTAIDTVLLLSADEIVPGPYTYRRFWFRDACLMMNALLSVGLVDRCRSALQRFPDRQTKDGYFQSQEGEWDSNGQVLWIANRFAELTGEPLSDELVMAVRNGMDWIDKKRVHDPGKRHDGLLPPGFSAEHLGTNDYYYWDDYWALAGLKAAAKIFERRSLPRDANQAQTLANELSNAIAASIDAVPDRMARAGIPASPYRRIDAGAVGSMVVDYPLQMCESGDGRVMRTIEILRECSFYRGGFFQDMIHSGINAYLTLAIAQTLLRAGDSSYRELMETVADLATPTGQWPEAIHPQTLGGCMGDGQHGWAAAEWIMMLRNCFVREEADRLVIGSGIYPEWLEGSGEVSFGPTLTPWGAVTVRILSTVEGTDSNQPLVTIDGHWRTEAPQVDVAIPGFEVQENVDTSRGIALQKIETHAYT